VAVGVASGTMHMQTGGTSILGKPKTHVHDTARGTRVYRKVKGCVIMRGCI
jgi:hypothetical protein